MEMHRRQQRQSRRWTRAGGHPSKGHTHSRAVKKTLTKQHYFHSNHRVFVGVDGYHRTYWYALGRPQRATQPLHEYLTSTL